MSCQEPRLHSRRYLQEGTHEAVSFLSRVAEVGPGIRHGWPLLYRVKYKHHSDCRARRLKALNQELNELRSQHLQEPAGSAQTADLARDADFSSSELPLHDDLTFLEDDASLEGTSITTPVVLEIFHT